MKTVKALKDKHQRDLWADSAGYVWFYTREGWKYLWPRTSDWGCLFGPAPDYEARDYGPYTRIQKGWR